jgi:hypothetical protein
MPYVLRNPQGLIDSLHREPVPGAQWLPPDHLELQQFVGDEPREGAFASLDAGLIRVLEDLVDVLVARNVINITDLPSEAQHKLFARKNFRERFQRNALQLFAAPDDLLSGRRDGAPEADWVVALAASGLSAEVVGLPSDAVAKAAAGPAGRAAGGAKSPDRGASGGSV